MSIDFGLIMILELSEEQFQHLASRKLSDVFSLVETVNGLRLEYPNLNRLLDCFLSGGSIEVIYHGGSSPGAIRELMPSKISKSGGFSAYCSTSDQTKSFKFEKVELVG